MGKATLEIRDFEPRDRAMVIELLSQDRPAHYRFLKEAVFDWQFGANPHDDGGTPFLVGTVDEQIVALIGFMPAKTRYKGNTLATCWICDIYVSAQFRGHGFGTQMIIRALNRAAVLMGFGISDMSDPIMDRGSTLCADNRILFFHAHEPGLKGAIKNARTRLIRLLNVSGKRHSPLQISTHEGDFGTEVDELWQRSAPGYFSIVERDAAFLNWKYRKHPLYRYSSYMARVDGQLRGLVVVRHSSVTSLMVDYCGPADDIDLMRALVSAATADLVARGTRRIRCEATHPEFLSALKRCGFVNSRYRSRFRIRTNIPGDEQAQPAWFLMSGDSDGDMVDTIPTQTTAVADIHPQG
jgi:GNAT superfamily N-acetyltransferase